jgi:serine/threonine protein kinase
MQPVPGYRLVRQLGAGAFGQVWEAVDDTDAVTALKFMDCRTKPSSLISSEIRVLRGLRELQHPNIIRLHNVQASGQYIVLIMERADGNLSDLKKFYLEETGTGIPAEYLLDLLDQVAEVLDFLTSVKLPGFNSSSVGLQHCDIKPANLLMLGDKVKVADFGLCAATSWQTHHKGWKGTLPYAAPELWRGQATKGTDQFALAVTYLYLVAGERPFYPIDTKSNAPPTMPVDFTKVRERELPALSRALHPHPTSRFPTCREFIAALRDSMRQTRRRLEKLTFPYHKSVIHSRA